MKVSFKAWTLLALMLFASLLAYAIRPTIVLASQRGEVNLDQQIPMSFGKWKVVSMATVQIVNPQQAVDLKRVYTNTLSRTFRTDTGEAVMLSIAYGPNQNGEYALHYPDVCYPAQGFTVISSMKSSVDTTFGPIRVKKMEASLGSRKEPVTYWSTVGNQVVTEGTNTKIAKLKYGIKGQIPDGLIFRVSSIDVNSEKAFRTQQEFINSLLQSLTPQQREFFAGIKTGTTDH